MTAMARIALLLAAMLAACAPKARNIKVAELQPPAAFEAAATGPSVATVDWRTYFADDTLVALIGEALAGNLDLQVALQRIELARAQVRASTGARLPQLSVVAGGSLTRWGLHTPEGAGNASTEITPGRITPNPVGELAVGLQASWEVDLWGRLRDLHGAARARYLATVEGANLVITNLVADVAVSYFQLLALDHVRAVLEQTIERQTRALDAIRAQKEAGRTNELAVQQLAAQLADTQALDASTLQETRELEHQLNLLLGRFPQPIARDKQMLEREVAQSLAAGVPSDLLRNRPDIREAELQVQASRFDLAAARRAFYPTLSITADIGYRAFEPRYLFATPASIVSSIAGGLVAPLVNRRALEAELAAAEASQLQAIFEYQRVLLTSVGEVAMGLSALEQTARVVEQRRQKKAAVAGTIETADALFRAGKATYLDVLLAQQSTLEAELELIEALRDHRIASVRLYRALGGGWRGVLDVQRATP